MSTPDDWLTAWRTLAAAGGPAGSGLPGAGLAGAAPGLAGAAAAFGRFAEDFGRLVAGAAASAGGPAAAPAGELEALAQRFFAGVVPAWPALPGADPAWLAAVQSGSLAVAEIARATATAFAARLAAPGAPTTLRGAFDAWIDCAEAAFRTTAHSEGYARAQATLLNEFVRLRARQQAQLEQAARAVGLPTRTEVDTLHAAVRELRAELAAARAAPPPPPSPSSSPSPPPRRRRSRP